MILKKFWKKSLVINGYVGSTGCVDSSQLQGLIQIYNCVSFTCSPHVHMGFFYVH